MRDKAGTLREELTQVENIVLGYFGEIFTTSNLVVDEYEPQLFDYCVTDEIRAELNKAYTKDEVASALQEMHPCKSTGPDGMHVLFYQQYWDLVSDEVCSVVLHVLNGC